MAWLELDFIRLLGHNFHTYSDLRSGNTAIISNKTGSDHDSNAAKHTRLRLFFNWKKDSISIPSFFQTEIHFILSNEILA